MRPTPPAKMNKGPPNASIVMQSGRGPAKNLKRAIHRYPDLNFENSRVLLFLAVLRIFVLAIKSRGHEITLQIKTKQGF